MKNKEIKIKWVSCILLMSLSRINCALHIGTEHLKGTETNSIDNNILDDEKTTTEIPEIDDNGEALILTPYIESNRLAEAREASKVPVSNFLGYKSHSGFFTVDEKHNSNSFFWYFPVVKKPVNETPWIIWLQGGPGASSLIGLFTEIGPYRVSAAGNLMPYPVTWLTNHSLVFIDNPIGTGFSFTNSEDGYARDMDTYGRHLFSTVKQLVTVFPELQTAPLYIAGESYAGKYVPTLAMQLHKHKDDPDFNINLQGLLIGNGYIDPEMLMDITRPYYYFGLLEKEQIKVVQPLLTALSQNIVANKSVEAKNNFIGATTALLTLAHMSHAYNFLVENINYRNYEGFLLKPGIRKDLHVGDIEYTAVNVSVNLNLAPEFLSTARPFYEELLENYRVLVFCGHLDLMMPCVVTSEHYRKWKWSSSEEFIKADKLPYIFRHKMSGYYKSGGNLTEFIVRGAGHMATMDKPTSTLHFISQWTHHLPIEQPTKMTAVMNSVRGLVKSFINVTNASLL